MMSHISKWLDPIRGQSMLLGKSPSLWKSSQSWKRDLLDSDYSSEPPEICHLNVKKLPKTWHFFKKIDKNCHFFQQNCHWQFCWIKWQFLSIFLKKMSSFRQFFDSQMAIFRRVSNVHTRFNIRHTKLLNFMILCRVVLAIIRLI